MRKSSVFAEQRNRKLNPPQVSLEQRLANIAVTHRKRALQFPTSSEYSWLTSGISLWLIINHK